MQESMASRPSKIKTGGNVALSKDIFTFCYNVISKVGPYLQETRGVLHAAEYGQHFKKYLSSPDNGLVPEMI